MTIKRLEKKFYPELEDNWDDDIFRDIVLSSLKSDMTMLDLGAGAGIVKQMDFKKLCKKVVGLDPDKRP
jgi:ribosomal protein L11 methylase PrmA